MNNKYTYLNGNVILNDREGNEYVTPNTDNMYDVVKQENFVEIIDTEIDNVQNAINEDEQIIKKNKFYSKIGLLMCFLMPIVFGVLTYIARLLPILGTNNVEMVKQFIIKIMNIFNSQSYAAYSSIAAFMATATLSYPLGILISLVYHFDSKWFKKHQVGKKKELEYLKAKKEEAEMTLEELKSKSQEIPLEEQPQEHKVIEVNNDLDYETLNEEQTNAYNEGLAEYQTLRRVRYPKK